MFGVFFRVFRVNTRVFFKKFKVGTYKNTRENTRVFISLFWIKHVFITLLFLQYYIKFQGKIRIKKIIFIKLSITSFSALCNYVVQVIHICFYIIKVWNRKQWHLQGKHKYFYWISKFLEIKKLYSKIVAKLKIWLLGFFGSIFLIIF